MSKVFKIDLIHLRAVMLCMSKMLNIKKEHTHTFMLITFSIINRFSIHKKLGILFCWVDRTCQAIALIEWIKIQKLSVRNGIRKDINVKTN